MKPSSPDLRDRLLPMLAAGQDLPPAIVERFGVRPSVVATRWQR